MKWLLIGGVLVGAGVFALAVSNNSSPASRGGSNQFGLAMYSGYPGASAGGAYGMAYYGGYPGAGAGYWKPSMLEGKGGQGTS